jgi:hypothetical protein
MSRASPWTDETLHATLWRRLSSSSLLVWNLRQILDRDDDPPRPRIHPTGYAPRRSARWVGYEQARGAWTRRDADWEVWGQRGVEYAKASILRIRDLARSRRIKLAVVVYPWPEQLRNQWGARFVSETWSDLGVAEGITLVDLVPVFLEHDDWRRCFIDGDAHWNEEGHQLVADELYRRLWRGSWAGNGGVGPATGIADAQDGL